MRTLKRRLWLAAIGSAAGLLILLGVLVGIFRIAVELVPGYRVQVESQVSTLLESPVRIGTMDLVWRGLYPTLQLATVVVGTAERGRLELEQLNLGFSLWRLARGDVTPRRVGLQGTRLSLTLEDGRIRSAGLASGTAETPPEEFLNRLLAIGDVVLEDARVTWHDRDHGLPPRAMKVRHLAVERVRGGMELVLDLSLPEQPGSRMTVQAQMAEAPWQLQEITAELTRIEPWEELHAWLPQLPALAGSIEELQFDARWQAGRWQEATADFALSGLRPANGEIGLPRWSARLHLTPAGDGYRINLDNRELVGVHGDWPAGVAVLDLRPATGATTPWRVSLDLHYARIQDLDPWASLLPGPWQAHWQDFAPRGELRDLVLQWNPADPWPVLTARFSDLGIAAAGGRPGLTGLSGSVSLDAAGGQLTMQSRELTLDAPQHFAQPLPIDQLGGTLSWERTDQGWQIQVPALQYAALSLDGVGRVSARLGPQPAVDLDLSFFCPEPRRWLDYQPLFWHPNLRGWLERAVREARVASGSLRVEGELADFPFTRAPGQFRLDLALEAIDLKFAPDWPALTAPAARLEIEGDSLSVAAASGRLGDLEVSAMSARIPELRDAQLAVSTQLAGDAKVAWAMLGASKLRRRLGQTLDAIDIAGRTGVDLSLDLPLKDLEKTDYKAIARLDRAALWTRFWPDPVKRIEGEVEISPAGLRGRDISAQLSGLPLSIDLQPQGKGQSRLDARTSIDLSALGDSFPVPAWLARRSRGSSPWRVEMSLGQETRLALHSRLEGTALDLPPPFGKTAEELRPVRIDIDPGADTRVHLTYAERLGLDLLLADGRTRAARLNLGGDALPAGAPGWWVEGQLQRAEFDRWLPLIQDLVQTDGPSDAMAFGGLVLQVADIEAFGQRFPDTRLQLTRRDTDWLLNLSGARALGELRMPADQGGARFVLSGRFERLNWGLSVRTDAVGPPLDPRLLPGLELSISNFSLNDRALGRLKLALQPVERGIRIAELRIAPDSDPPELDLSGLWLRDDRGSSAAMDFSMNTAAFRSWLGAFGYQRSLDAQRGMLSGRLQWEPHEDGLMPAALGGNLNVEFNNGQLLTVEPGAGRMLGLFSINALPRRFVLDFRDVVDSGLGFDKLSGSFSLENGVAHTEDFSVESPSLRIAARGDVDLAERSYAQTITIYPGLSSGVTLAATVLGGPAVGLFTLFAQELLDKPLDQVTQLSYRLSGTWDNPQVEPLQ